MNKLCTILDIAFSILAGYNKWQVLCRPTGGRPRRSSRQDTFLEVTFWGVLNVSLPTPSAQLKLDTHSNSTFTILRQSKCDTQINRHSFRNCSFFVPHMGRQVGFLREWSFFFQREAQTDLLEQVKIFVTKRDPKWPSLGIEDYS